jgi:hypothetical protein
MSRFSKFLDRARWNFRPAAELAVSDAPNQRFRNFAENGAITIPRRPIFNRSDAFFAMGSCFAEEIRIALNARSIKCLPSYSMIEFDKSQAIIDELPEREHMNFYNTFTIRAQLEQMLGLWEQPDDDYWHLKRSNTPWGKEAYQDPYRRLVIARTPEILHATVASIVQTMRDGFFDSSAFIFTFGMTEVFRDNRSGRVVAQNPLYKGGGGASETKLHLSTFAENHENVTEIVRIVRQAKPSAPIVLTVSPVGLKRTFREMDVITANMESKSILRSVLGQVCREHENVFYLPSYEYVTALGYNGAYELDRRHVKRDVVEKIVGAFFDSTFTS